MAEPDSESSQKANLDTQLSALFAVLSVVIPVPDRIKPILTALTALLIVRTAFKLFSIKSDRFRAKAAKFSWLFRSAWLCGLIASTIVFFPRKEITTDFPEIAFVSPPE